MKEVSSDGTQGMRKEVGVAGNGQAQGQGHVHQVRTKIPSKRRGQSLDNCLEGTETREELGR